MKILFKVLILFTIAFSLRIYQIDKVPAGLSNDEIAFGYNAYSILKTGKDDHGISYPLFFRSNEDYKLPGQVYIISLLLPLFGNTELAIRLPSVLAGSLTVLVVFFLVGKLTDNSKLSFSSGLLLAISPWHVYTSRVAFDSNVALLFVCLGALFFILGLKKRLYFFLSVLAFILSVYIYHTQWVFTPLLIISLLIIYWEKVKKIKKSIFLSFILYLLLFTPILLDYLNIMHESTRINTENLLKDPNLGILLSKYGDNIFSKILITVNFWIDHYLSYLNPSFLFFNGLPIPSEYSLQRFGLFLILLLPFYFYGIYLAVKNRSFPKIFIVWFFLAPLIPSLTLGPTSIERNVVQVIPITVLISFGLVSFLEKKKNWQKFLIVILIFNFGFFYYNYIKHFAIQSAESWAFGEKQIAEIVKNYPDKKIVLDPVYGTEDRTIYGLPHLYIMYFNEEDPNLIINVQEIGDEIIFGRFTIKPVNWYTEKLSSNTIYVVRAQDILPKDYPAKEVAKIKLPNGEEVFKIYLTD